MNTLSIIRKDPMFQSEAERLEVEAEFDEAMSPLDKNPCEGMTDDEICCWEEQNEYRLAVQERNENGRIPGETETTIGRYYRFIDEPDEYTCDTVIVDRTTGDVIGRYDAADPANTNPYYGAEGDGTWMARKGISLGEVISKDCPGGYLTADQIHAKFPQYERWDDYEEWDDGWGDEDD